MRFAAAALQPRAKPEHARAKKSARRLRWGCHGCHGEYKYETRPGRTAAVVANLTKPACLLFALFAVRLRIVGSLAHSTVEEHSGGVPFNPWRRLCTPRTEQQAAGRLSVIAQQRVRPSGGLHPLLRHPKRQIHVSTA